jgi:hypothetical protein
MRLTFGLIALLAFVAAPAAAQMTGNPVYVPVGMGTGVSVAGDFALGLNDASLKTTYFGARATLGLPFFYVTAGVGSVKPDEDLVGPAESEIAFGGDIGFKVLNLPLVPVKIAAQAGAGYLKFGDAGKQLDIPIAVGIGLSLPTPGVGITPWIAPRGHVRISDDGVDTETDFRFGGSAGLNVKFGLIGGHVAVDYINFSAPEGSGLSSGDVSPLVLGVGLSVGLGVPGL